MWPNELSNLAHRASQSFLQKPNKKGLQFTGSSTYFLSQSAIQQDAQGTSDPHWGVSFLHRLIGPFVKI